MLDYEFRWIVTIYEREDPEYVGYTFQYKGEKDDCHLYLVTICARDWDEAKKYREKAEKEIPQQEKEAVQQRLYKIGGNKEVSF